VAERQVGVLVENLFLRVPIEEAVSGAGARAVLLADLAAAAGAGCGLVVADLDVLGPEAEAHVRSLVSSGRAVVIFGARGDDERLAAVRRAGAVAMPRSLFLQQLPEILACSRDEGRRPAGVPWPM
jgi:hypothetical protein